MALSLTLADLSDEGLDLLLRIVLKTDERHIDSWTRMGALMEEYRTEISFSEDGTYCDASFGTEPMYFSAPHAKAAIASAVIWKLKPEGLALGIPPEKIHELLSEAYKQNSLRADMLKLDLTAGRGENVTVDITTEC